jgi:hypothetical protein
MSLRNVNVFWTLGLLLCVASRGEDLRLANTYRFDGKKFEWKVFVDEPFETLKQINCIEYTLHPAFRNRVRLQCDGFNRFALSETGLNEFTIVVAVEWKDGRKTSQAYALDLHSGGGQDETGVTAVELSDPLLKGIDPLVLESVGRSEIILADRDGALLDIALKNGGFAVTRLRRWGVDEMVTGVLGRLAGQPTTLLSVMRTGRPMLDPFPSRGAGYGPWFGLHRGRFGSLCVDGSGETLYAVEPADPPRIYSLDLRTPHAHLEEIMDLPDLGGTASFGAGPVLWLSADRLLVFSANGSAFYNVDLKSRRVKDLVLRRGASIKSLKGPQAVVFDPVGERILVADGNLIRSIKINSEDNTIAITEFGPGKIFKSLSAITRDTSGRIWVGDSQLHSIFVLSDQGVLEKRLRGR